MSCLALSLQPVNGPDILLQTREWFPPSRALMAISSFRQIRLAFAAKRHSTTTTKTNSDDSSADPSSLGDDPLAASSGQVIVGVESRYRVVYRLANSIYVLAITTVEEENNNVFECINIVNQAVSVIVTACRGIDVSPEKLSKKYAEVYMALDIVLKGVSGIRLSAMLASMHGEGIAKMVHSAMQTESNIRGADSWGLMEVHSLEHEGSVDAFSKAYFELPLETLQAGDEMAATMAFSGVQGDEKEENKVDEKEEEKDPFAASAKINQPGSLVGGFKKDKDQSTDLTKALAGLEVTTLPPAAATDSTHIGVEGFEGNYGGIEFSNDGSTLPDDFEGINNAWGGGLDPSEYVGTQRVKKQEGLGGLELLETSEPPKKDSSAGSDGAGKNLEDVLLKKTEMKGPEMYVAEEISAEFRESLLARVGFMGMVYLRTLPPMPSDEETEFSFKVDGTNRVKRLVMQSSRLSSLGNGMFHVRTVPLNNPIPILKFSLLPHQTPLPLRVRIVKRLSGTLLSVMIQYVSNPDLTAPLNNVTFVLKLPVDPSLLKVSPKAVLNRPEKELKWLVDEIPLKGNPGKLRVRMPVDIRDEDDEVDLEVVCYVKFSAQWSKTLSGISFQPASEGKTDFYVVDHRCSSGEYICN